MKRVLGLDIGGANLKAAHTCGAAKSTPFKMWRDPAALPFALKRLIVAMPAFDTAAITMTGELCDCFATKSDGVRAILDAIGRALGSIPRLIWTTAGRFVSEQEARAEPNQAASANWLALAAFACRFTGTQSALLIDIGSTTADLVPLRGGTAVPRGRTDLQRLRSGELFYRGVDRTPVCALMGTAVAAEWFATMLDVHLVLGNLPENPANRRTADARPATIDLARARLARMLCEDPDVFSLDAARQLACRIHEIELRDLVQAIDVVIAANPQPPTIFVLAGAGEFLARLAVRAWLQRTGGSAEIHSIGAQLGPALSEAACAYAVAILAGEMLDVR